MKRFVIIVKKLIIFLGTEKGRFPLIILVYVISFMLMSLGGMLGNLIFDIAPNLSESVAGVLEIILTGFSMIIVGIFAFYGWKALSAITPNIFLIMPIVGWVIYFVVKATLSIVVGIFVIVNVTSAVAPL